MRRIYWIFFSAILLGVGCSKNSSESFFKKQPASHTGITFKNELKDTPELNILTYLYYYNGAGVAAGDFNNDNLVDLYFTSNQGADKLYINKGGFKFEDITEAANINNSDGWTTGVTHVDINNDGLLDIYICKVGNYKTIQGKNLLYVNQGVDENGISSFKEEASKYNLDFSGFSTQAAFFDYDIDGDLDMYLLNHSVNPNRSYGKGIKRKQIDSLSGDVLYRNDNGNFVDVSAEAGIFQGGIGYGLGLGVSDINNDGYPDIYVGNDFFENDYLYINQKNGTFKEVISEDQTKLGHTSHFSMGNDIADINNDGLTDIISLDMLPENLETYKTSGLEYAFPVYQQYLKNGFAPQYMQNTLHLNLGNTNFSEIANLSGISASEWSWGPLFADFDNDGHKDIFISNGIKGATNDMDFISFIANDKIQKQIEEGMSEKEMAFINELPEKKVANYFFKNNGNLTFKNVTDSWSNKENSFSNGCVYADLDNDGDLDLVVNNVNDEAFILENTLDSKPNYNSIQVTFKGNKENTFGIGAKLIANTTNGTLAQENYVSRGYLSAVPNTLHLGIGKDSILASLTVIWPTGKYQKLESVNSGRLEVEEKNASGNFYAERNNAKPSIFIQRDSLVSFVHKEQPTYDFDRDPLAPFANTNEGPSILVADVNNDDLQDIFISGAKAQASRLYIQTIEGTFIEEQEDVFSADAFNEDVSHVFFDANGDDFQDLVVVSAGNEFKSSNRIQPRFYLNQNGTFLKDPEAFKGVELNASKVTTVDFDGDGHTDICITSDQVPQQFGTIATQYLFKNNGEGVFEDVTSSICPSFKSIGNVKDIIWSDLDGNGFKDLVALGDWMPISIFMNDGKKMELISNNGLDKTHGFWNSIIAEDFDNDGDLDLVAGNWGNNSKLKASVENPITLYSHDFDDNGSIEPLVTYFYNEKETPFASKDELVKQMPFLNKKFLSYESFAKASLEDLFGSENLKNAQQKKVYELSSCYFENTGDITFKKIKLPSMAQVSTINDIIVDDFDKDGHKDILAVGNNYEISTQLGRMDASHGILLRFGENGFQWVNNVGVNIPGPARSIKKIMINKREYYVVGINDSTPLFLEKIQNE
ncbi:VCBS repeat-containing protein [Allomuricauda sp. R78024]|uniref:VCBS repeat-containing protein n=1 Tax=Allomuricauda sp. R78024 TaxID=3093867 RepID=UPI0037CAB0F0